MKREKLLAREIEDLRTDLQTVIEEKKELIDPEVLKASQSLDKVLNQYYRMSRMNGQRILEEGAE